MAADVALVHSGAGISHSADAVRIGGRGDFGLQARRLEILTGSGDDTIELAATTVYQDAVVATGQGNDTLVTAGAAIGRDLVVYFGLGDDRFDATGGNNSVGRRTILAGGWGDDSADGLDEPTNNWGQLWMFSF